MSNKFFKQSWKIDSYDLSIIGSSLSFPMKSYLASRSYTSNVTIIK